MLFFFKQFQKIYVGDQVILLSEKTNEINEHKLKFIFIYIVSGTLTSINMVSSRCAKQRTCFGQSGVALQYIM